MTNLVKPVLALLSEGTLDTEYGEFRMSVFHDGHEQAIVLSKGKLSGRENVLCRVHSECISAHFFSGTVCDCKQQMMMSQELIQREGKGLIILLEQEGRGCGAAAHAAILDLKRDGMEQPRAYEMIGFPDDVRRYDIAAKIIKFLKIKSVVLVSSSRSKIESLKNRGIEIVDTTDISDFVVLGRAAENRVAYIKRGESKPVVDRSKEREKWILVIGDLNIDSILSPKSLPTGGILDRPEPVVGGTAFNAACAFNNKGFTSIIFGKIGNDNDGQTIQRALRSKKMISLVGISDDKRTGTCSVIFVEETNARFMIKDESSANDYDLDHLEQALQISQIGAGDLIFVVGHSFVRLGVDHTKKLIDMVSSTGARIIMDVVPHNMYESITLNEFSRVIEDKVHVLISEYNTLMRLAGYRVVQEHPTADDLEELFCRFNSTMLVVRSGVGNISRQVICKRTHCDTVDHEQVESPAGITVKQALLSELLAILTERFSKSELDTLCFRLGVDPEMILKTEEKVGRARELISHFKQRNCLHNLLAVGAQMRTDIRWPRLASYRVLEENKDTGYTTTPAALRRGFGDHLTAELLSKYYKDILS